MWKQRLVAVVGVSLLAFGAVGCAGDASDEDATNDGDQEEPLAGGNDVRFDSARVLHINGKPTFPIGFTMPPPAAAIAPSGRTAFDELKMAGANFLRTGVFESDWNEAAIAHEHAIEDAAAAHGMYTWLNLHEAAAFSPTDREGPAVLRRLVHEFKSHRALAVYKGADEPQTNGVPARSVSNAYNGLRSLDKHHPVCVIQAPDGSVPSLQEYEGGYDINGFDIYPVADKYGTQTDRPNKTISVVGNLAQTAAQQLGGKSTWMTLQIAWAGVDPAKSGNAKVRFPTFREERFMTYDAIINGARGLFYFGGHNEFAWQDRADVNARWAWKFWDDVLVHVVREVGDRSPLHSALLVPDQTTRAKASTSDVEFVVRSVAGPLYVIAARRAGTTGKVTFTGLPVASNAADVLFESRKVSVKAGSLTDNFDLYDVHVYRLSQ